MGRTTRYACCFILISSLFWFTVVYPAPAGTQERSAAVHGLSSIFFLLLQIYLCIVHGSKSDHKSCLSCLKKQAAHHKPPAALTHADTQCMTLSGTSLLVKLTIATSSYIGRKRRNRLTEMSCSSCKQNIQTHTHTRQHLQHLQHLLKGLGGVHFLIAISVCVCVCEWFVVTWGV